MNNQQPPEGSRAHALLLLYHCLNSPAKAGPKWVIYGRDQANAMLEVVKQLMKPEGFTFERTDNAGAS